MTTCSSSKWPSWLPKSFLLFWHTAGLHIPLQLGIAFCGGLAVACEQEGVEPLPGSTAHGNLPHVIIHVLEKPYMEDGRLPRYKDILELRLGEKPPTHEEKPIFDITQVKNKPEFY